MPAITSHSMHGAFKESHRALARKHEWLKVPEVAQVLRIARSRAYDLVAEGEIPSVGIGCSVRVSYKELDRWPEVRSWKPCTC